MFTNYSSCITLLIISIDRLIAIRWPLRYHFYVTKKRITLALLASWIYVLILGCLPFIPQKKKSREGCSYKQQKEWSTAMLLANTLLPFIIICYCYAYIFTKARDFHKRKMAKTTKLESRKYKANRSKLKRKNATSEPSNSASATDSESNVLSTSEWRTKDAVVYRMNMCKRMADDDQNSVTTEVLELNMVESTDSNTAANSSMEEENEFKRIRGESRNQRNRQNRSKLQRKGATRVPSQTYAIEDSGNEDSESNGMESSETDTNKKMKPPVESENRKVNENHRVNKIAKVNLRNKNRQTSKPLAEEVTQKQNKDRPYGSPKVRRKRIFAEIVAARMSLFVVFAYILCWGPSFMYYLLLSLCPSCYPKSFFV